MVEVVQPLLVLVVVVTLPLVGVVIAVTTAVTFFARVVGVAAVTVRAETPSDSPVEASPRAPTYLGGPSFVW